MGRVSGTVVLREIDMADDGSDSRADHAGGFFPDRSMPIPEGRKWPSRLREFSVVLQNPPDEQAREEARERVWRILNGAICLYIRLHAARLGRIAREDREDLAAERSMRLLLRIESGRIDFSDRQSSEIAGFISRTVRNALLDFLRREGRRVGPIGDYRQEWDESDVKGRKTMGTTVAPDIPVQCREFAAALRRCVELLDPRAALCWFFRVFYEMASRDIAVHPRIRLKVGHVDVLLQRSRTMIRDCVSRSGFDPHDMPPGTFVEMWKTFRSKGGSV